MTKLELALYHAALGRRVFPVVDKHPTIKWKDGATTDHGTIVDMWGQWPDADPAWALPADVLVLDVDNKNDGPLSLELLELEHGDFPAPTQRTRGGGAHYVFHTTTAVPNSAGRIGSGLDVRSAGGYIVLYADFADAKESAPDWLVEAAHRRIETRDSGVVELDQPANIARAVEYLSRCKPAIEGQGGNNWTFATACIVRDFGVSEDKALDVLAAWNATCVPPWSAEELGGVVHNAYAYAARGAGSERASGAASLSEIRIQSSDKPTAQRGRFTPLTWGELQKMPDPTWVFDGTLAEQSLAMIYGAYGTYKSFLAIDLALSAATGRPWAQHEARRPYRCVYIAGEGAHGIRLRVTSWAAANGLDAVDTFRLIPIMPLFGRDNDLTDLADGIRPFAPELIVVDTVAHAMAGLDENAQKDAGIFVARCAELRNAFSATVLLVHHTGKDEDKGARGSTVIPAALDTVWRTRVPRDREVGLRMEKQKDAAKWEPDEVGFTGKLVGGSLVFTPGTLTTSHVQNQDTHRRAVMLEILQASPSALTNEALAFEMARALASGADATTQEQLTASITRWLQRLGKTPDVAHLCLHVGSGRHDPHLWGITKEGNHV